MGSKINKMPNFISLHEVYEESVTKSLLLNIDEIASCDKPECPSGNTRITMKDGRVYIVEESINTIKAIISNITE